MLLSEECSPDAQKHQDRIVTPTILIKKIKKKIYKDLWKLNNIGYTEEWSREMLPLQYNTTCTRKLYWWEKSIFVQINGFPQYKTIEKQQWKKSSVVKKCWQCKKLGRPAWIFFLVFLLLRGRLWISYLCFCKHKANLTESIRNQSMQEIWGETFLPILTVDYCVMTLIVFLQSMVWITSSLTNKSRVKWELGCITE